MAEQAASAYQNGVQSQPEGQAESALNRLWLQHRSGPARLLSPRLWDELRLRSSFDLDLLAPARIANRVRPGTVPDCERCDDICCAGLENLVSLRLRDIAVLMDIGRTDLISRKKPRFPAVLLAEKPHLEELVRSELWRTLPVLRQVGESRICAALSPSLRCTLHPHWPLSCERFPYSLKAARREVVWGLRCPSQAHAPEHEPRSRALFEAAVETYNERIRDAVLLAHARPQLDRLGLGAFLVAPNEDPFEEETPQPGRLPVIR